MQNKKLVLFDFDGVLANTIEISYKIHKEANSNLSWEMFSSFSDGNFLSGIGKAVEDGTHILPKDFFTPYESQITSVNIHDVLKRTVEILSKDYILCIVSSMRTQTINNFLQKEGIPESFSNVLGADVHSSKVVKIKTVLDKYKVKPSDCVFITDTLGDVLEANECKVRSIGVLWGLHGVETLEKGKPAKIIDNPMHLLDSVKEILG